jgi:hypothetical protein
MPTTDNIKTKVFTFEVRLDTAYSKPVGVYTLKGINETEVENSLYNLIKKRYKKLFPDAENKIFLTCTGVNELKEPYSFQITTNIGSSSKIYNVYDFYQITDFLNELFENENLADIDTIKVKKLED